MLEESQRLFEPPRNIARASRLLRMIFHEARHFGQILRGLVGRQRLEKNSTILHSPDAVIENRQNSAIRLRPDQSPESLLQRQHRFRHLIFRKRIPPVLLQRLHARRHNRIARHRERQLIDNHARKLRSRHVHSLPETRRRKQHRIRRRSEPVKQHRTRRRPLQQQWKRNPRGHSLVHVLHLRVAGEKTKRAPLGNLQHARNLIRRARRKFRVPHVRHRWRNVQQRLLAKIEFLRQHFFIRRLNSKPLLQIVESPAHSKSSRRQHHRIELVEQPLPQNLAHVDRRRRKKHTLPAPLVPVNVAFLFALQQKFQLAPDFRRAPRQRHHFLRLRRKRRKFRLHSLHRAGQFLVPLQVPLEKRAALGLFKRKAPFALRKSFKETVPSLAHPAQIPPKLRRCNLQHPQSILRIARQLVEPVARNLTTEVIAGHILDLVRLVKHHRRIFRKDRPEIVLANCKVGKKERVVHNNQVRFLRPLVHRRDETVLKLRAFLSRAKIAARVNPVPKLGVVRQKSQFAAVARLRQLLPILDLREPVHFVDAFQHRLPHHLVYLLTAEKIRSPLHQRRFQIRREMFLQEGNVLLKKLLLKRFCCGRNHHPPPAANCRNQIRQRLPSSRPRFDHHMLMFLKRIVSHLSHLELRGAKLIPRMPLFEQTSGPEDLVDRYFFSLRRRLFFSHPDRSELALRATLLVAAAFCAGFYPGS